MSRKKFKIYYPIDHQDPEKAGRRFKPDEGEMIVMNNQGIFFLVGGLNDFYLGMQKLSDRMNRYDVVWGDEDG